MKDFWEPEKEPERKDFDRFETCDTVPRLILLVLAGVFLGVILFNVSRYDGRSAQAAQVEKLP